MNAHIALALCLSKSFPEILYGKKSKCNDQPSKTALYWKITIPLRLGTNGSNTGSSKGLRKGHHNFDPNSSNSLRPFTGVAAAERSRLAFHALTSSTLTGIFVLDTRGSCSLTATTSCSARNAETLGFSSAAALSSAAAKAPVEDDCAIRCTDTFARVEEEGWMYWLKNSSMSFFVSGSMFSTSR